MTNRKKKSILVISVVFIFLSIILPGVSASLYIKNILVFDNPSSKVMDVIYTIENNIVYIQISMLFIYFLTLILFLMSKLKEGVLFIFILIVYLSMLVSYLVNYSYLSDMVSFGRIELSMVTDIKKIINEFVLYPFIIFSMYVMILFFILKRDFK